MAATARPVRSVGLDLERALRTAAATLRTGSRRDISAVSVLVALGLDDLDGLTELTSDVAAEFGLLASLRPMVGACSVRFKRRESDSTVVDNTNPVLRAGTQRSAPA